MKSGYLLPFRLFYKNKIISKLFKIIAYFLFLL
jgi:hypothetical protein